MAGQFDTQFAIGLKDNFSTRYRQIRDEVKQAQQARERLGIKSEQSIRNEIRQTESAYQQLARSSIVSAGEQSRAFDKMTEKVSKLRRELGETERTQSRLARGLKVAGTLGAGAVGVAVAMRKPIEDSATYDSHLRKQANFAYSNSDLSGRTRGMDTIDRAIRHGVRESGATPDDAFAGLETMQRSGQMSVEQSYTFLPGVLRNAVATGADATSVANLQASAVNFGLNDKDAQAALSVATTMAQHGSVDVPLMAHELPRGLEAGKSAGFYGPRGFAQLSAFYEASAIGSKDPMDATTNANDFLAELTANNLESSGKRLKIAGKNIDIRTMMRKDLAAGLTPLDTVTGVINKLDTTDPEYRKYQKQQVHTTDPNAREKLEAQLMQIHGQHISALFPNQQARNAYINFDRHRDVFNRLSSEGEEQFKLPDERRSATQDFKLQKDSPEWKFTERKNETLFATIDAMKKPTTLLADLSDKAAHLAQEFPALAKASVDTAIAIKGLGLAASGILALGALKKGGGLLSGLMGKGQSVIEGAGASEVASVTGKVAAGLGGKLLRFGSVLGDVSMVMGTFYTEFLERGKDKVAQSGGNVPAGLPQPVGGLDVFDEVRHWLSGDGAVSQESSASRVRDQGGDTSTSEALRRLQNWPTPNANAGNAAAPPSQQQAAPPLPPINIYLDGALMNQHILQQAELNNRRYGQ
ncbi:phage tail tape measure protein [Serratia liquefaciens]|uniref:phage tail tape measure protein n=1 Tax=Serratia liquefaciens TaxID=614 RepID=UPI003906B222